jgi:uncharacterized protein (TIGR02217 family)
MSFLETPRFPDEIAAWAVGGRAFMTTVVETYGGDEYRNAAWAQTRGMWTFEDGLRSVDAQSATYAQKLLRNFFLVQRGQLNGFRFKDFSDYSDEGGGVFVGLTATTFQMYKQYSSGALTYTQIIQKPLSPTVVVTGGSGASVDYTTGIVTVSSGTPTSWTGQFDVPVRFGADVPQNGLDPSGALYNWQGIVLIEIRNPNG